MPPVDRKHALEQVPTALEFNDPDNFRNRSGKVPSFRQSSAKIARRLSPPTCLWIQAQFAIRNPAPCFASDTNSVIYDNNQHSQLVERDFFLLFSFDSLNRN